MSACIMHVQTLLVFCSPTRDMFAVVQPGHLARGWCRARSRATCIASIDTAYSCDVQLAPHQLPRKGHGCIAVHASERSYSMCWSRLACDGHMQSASSTSRILDNIAWSTELRSKTIFLASLFMCADSVRSRKLSKKLVPGLQRKSTSDPGRAPASVLTTDDDHYWGRTGTTGPCCV